MSRVAIIGAGISGLALAFRLQQLAPQIDITVLEKNSRPGGNVWTFEENGFLIEAGPNGFLDNKPSTLALCKDLGISDQLIAASDAASRNRYVFRNNKLRRLPNSLVQLITTGVLSWRAKLNVATERFRSPRKEASDESITDFFTRRLGSEIAHGLADAFVTGIYAGDPSLLSVRACFPRLVAMEERFGSLTRGMNANAKKRREEAKAAGQESRTTGRMWSFRSGLSVLIEALVAQLRQKPILGTAVQRVQKSQAADKGWLITAEDGSPCFADAVVLTCPAYEQARLLADVDSQLAEEIGEIAYNRLAVIALGYRQADVPMRIDGFGYLVPQAERRDLLGVQWCSSIFPGRVSAGMVLMRAMCGGWQRGDMVDWDEARLLKAVRDELRLAMGVQEPPICHHIIRWPRAIPQYFLGHAERVSRIEAGRVRYPGLFVGGNAYRGVALNDCTEQADLLAQRIHSYLSVKS